MKNTQQIRNSLFAITSGILTNTISNSLSVLELSPFTNIIISLLLFVLIWLIIAIIVPGLFELVKGRILFFFGKIINSKEIMNNYLRVKSRYCELLTKSKGLKQNNQLCLISSDVMECINELYCAFCGKNKIQRVTVKSMFRDYSTVKDINNRISIYEYNTLVNGLISLADEVFKVEGSEMDKKEIDTMVNKLLEVPPSLRTD